MNTMLLVIYCDLDMFSLNKENLIAFVLNYVYLYLQHSNVSYFKTTVQTLHHSDQGQNLVLTAPFSIIYSHYTHMIFEKSDFEMVECPHTTEINVFNTIYKVATQGNKVKLSSIILDTLTG